MLKSAGIRSGIMFLLLAAAISIIAGCGAKDAPHDETGVPTSTATLPPHESSGTYNGALTGPTATISAKPAPTPEPTPEGMVMLAEGFTRQPVPEDVKERMRGKSYTEDCTVPYEDLRYLRIRHVGFDGQDKRGEMVVNAKIAEDVLEIFRELYEAGYKIERMVLIDEYDASDEASMTDNNTSAFCYRTISGTDKLSYHARGLAVDVNPLYNPYVSDKKIEPAAGKPYTDRSGGNEYYIDEDDLCYKLFSEHGFFWGGNWNSVKDYQHFEMQD